MAVPAPVPRHYAFGSAPLVHVVWGIPAGSDRQLRVDAKRAEPRKGILDLAGYWLWIEIMIMDLYLCWVDDDADEGDKHMLLARVRGWQDVAGL
ncbi:hypothetical protein BU23DRAFT_80169 [Bimuria novae-zelandiae CBS 107.79]|uniref:Uncharacterized protein n=1 Tax=Bimuria novae-zelandiae CBS 107.79 TaxID=1447943 RepID=A0A6A5VEI4_9PLEO|nr:hypothetical protein BU23DRAFT_80169 [Bimuria novae-zelandiae CBS 107.79]